MGKGGVYAPKGEIPEYAEAFKNAGYGTSGNSKDVEARVVHQKGKPIKGQPEEGDFAVGAVTVKELGVAEVRVKTRWCSVDPYMKFPMRALLESECIGFKPGDIVRGRWGWGDVRNIHGADLTARTIHDGRPSTALGVLGMPGRTAYFGLFNILKPEPGQTIFISGGAGCVGSCVAQMAKAKGCKVFGSTTHASKVAWMESIGYEGVLNGYYMGGPPHYESALRKLMPDGVDLFFDCVGGELSEGVFRLLNDGGRVAVCGAMSNYCAANLGAALIGPLYSRRGLLCGLWNLATNATEALNNLKFANMARVETMKAMGAAHNLQEAPHDFEFPDGRKITWEAFVEGRFLVEEEEAEDYLAAMIDAGTLKYEEDIVVGDLDVIPDAFCRLFHGSNHGKMLVKLDPKIGAENKTAAWFADRAKRANEVWQAEVDDFMGPAKE
ncbi:prostaglandin reductase [Aureococcus anophagefferens]|nr:prostaglandin reductase [Aureococcus anophagefferens]